MDVDALATSGWWYSRFMSWSAAAAAAPSDLLRRQPRYVCAALRFGAAARLSLHFSLSVLKTSNIYVSVSRPETQLCACSVGNAKGATARASLSGVSLEVLIRCQAQPACGDLPRRRSGVLGIHHFSWISVHLGSAVEIGAAPARRGRSNRGARKYAEAELKRPVIPARPEHAVSLPVQ